MAGQLKLYYSSGSSLTTEFGKDPAESIGGVITDVEVVDGLNNLFRTLSQKSLSDGLKEYRIIFLKNIGDAEIADLQFYHKVPATTNETDPSALAPNDGDEYIVPSNATGEWLNKDGMKATYVLATTSWNFDFPPFSNYKFGFIAPVDITINDTLYTGSFVDTLDSIFEKPFGVSFIEADDVDGSTQVTIGDGTLGVDDILAMVIERSVEKQKLPDLWYSCPDDSAGDETTRNPGEATKIIDEQTESIIFNYDDGAGD